MPASCRKAASSRDDVRDSNTTAHAPRLECGILATLDEGAGIQNRRVEVRKSAEGTSKGTAKIKSAKGTATSSSSTAPRNNLPKRHGLKAVKGEASAKEEPETKRRKGAGKGPSRKEQDQLEEILEQSVQVFLDERHAPAARMTVSQGPATGWMFMCTQVNMTDGYPRARVKAQSPTGGEYMLVSKHQQTNGDQGGNDLWVELDLLERRMRRHILDSGDAKSWPSYICKPKVMPLSRDIRRANDIKRKDDDESPKGKDFLADATSYVSPTGKETLEKTVDYGPAFGWKIRCRTYASGVEDHVKPPGFYGWSKVWALKKIMPETKEQTWQAVFRAASRLRKHAYEAARARGDTTSPARAHWNHGGSMKKPAAARGSMKKPAAARAEGTVKHASKEEKEEEEEDASPLRVPKKRLGVRAAVVRAATESKVERDEGKEGKVKKEQRGVKSQPVKSTVKSGPQKGRR